MAGWLRVEVGCDMKIKDERTVSHINMDIIWNVFTLISGGYHNQTPADWRCRVQRLRPNWPIGCQLRLSLILDVSIKGQKNSSNTLL